MRQLHQRAINRQHRLAGQMVMRRHLRQHAADRRRRLLPALVPTIACLYVGLVVAFVLLNYYLHCGVTLKWVEAVLPRLFFNTSAFHNIHHSHTRMHFGEAMTLWDHVCKTRIEHLIGSSSNDMPTTRGIDRVYPGLFVNNSDAACLNGNRLLFAWKDDLFI